MPFIRHTVFIRVRDIIHLKIVCFQCFIIRKKYRPYLAVLACYMVFVKEKKSLCHFKNCLAKEIFF